MKSAAFLLCGGTLLLAACAPAYRAPPSIATASAPETWREPLPDRVVPVAQDWWMRFDDPLLGRYVEQALARNTDVLVAIARAEEAEANARLAGAARLPTLDALAAGGAQRQMSEVTGEGVNSIYAQPQLSAAWNADLFGRLRNLDAAARLTYIASKADRNAARLAIASATARGYIGLLSIDAQLQASRRTLRSREEALRIAQDRAAHGYSSQLELTQAQSEYESIAQTIPQLEQAFRLQENALRLLTGDTPGAVPHGSFAALTVPAVPAMLPSQLLRSRPDLIAAEARLAAADRTMAARRGEFLPDVRLSASIGGLFVDARDYDPVSIWSLGGSILAPIFAGGRLSAQYDSATAQRDVAAFAYRGVVLTALSEVENALTGEIRLREQVASTERRRTVLERSLGFAHDRYQAGYASYLEELDAQRNLYTVELAVISLRERQMANLIQLWAAMGGGLNEQ